MSPRTGGFYIEQIAVLGNDLPPAEVEFSDGLNVISGASDTGKSYLCSLIDFAFGASTPPRRIGAAAGYERVIVRLRSRSTNEQHEIERSLAGGEARLRTISEGRLVDERIASAIHGPNDNSTLSAFLLGLSGFGPTLVRKNRKGETRTLSFRDVAFLCVVEEDRIIAERPPHLSGSFIERTAESEVLRILVTGFGSPIPIVTQKKSQTQAAKARTEILDDLIQQLIDEIDSLGVNIATAPQQLESIDLTKAVQLSAYESTRVELIDLERDLASGMRGLREIQSRLVILDGLLVRYQLLDRHYASDILRLEAIQEAGTILEMLPTKSCPVCGAPSADHRQSEAEEHFGTDLVKIAASKELEKTSTLRHDLRKLLEELAKERAEKKAEFQRMLPEIRAIEHRIADELQPRIRATSEDLRTVDNRRDTLMRARTLAEQLDDLTKRHEQDMKKANPPKPAPSGVAEPRTSEMEGFVEQVHTILLSWNYPEIGRVVYSEQTQDLVIGGQERASHGKGVRALTCAAFIVAIQRHCILAGLPHPGLLILDSPLVTYKDPDVAGTESARLRHAGVKDAFYSSLTDGLCPGQVVVFENEDPSPEAAQRINHYHFTKARDGRYGFFPQARPS